MLWEGRFGSFSGTYPGAVVCFPAHLAGWDQPHGPGAAALETGEHESSCQKFLWTES